MAGKPLTDEQIRARIDALETTKNADGTFNGMRAAKAAGIARPAMQHFMARKEAGFYDTEKLLNAEAEDVGFDASAVSNYWVKTKGASYHVKRDVQVDVIQTIKEHFQDYKPKPAPKISAPRSTDSDTLTLYPLADLHLGLLAWGKETGADWDLPTAIAAYRSTMQRVSAASPASAKAIILGGGDLLHTTDYSNQTQSGNILDVDSRWPKILKSAIDLLVFQIDLALAKHKEVTARVLPGNHDRTAAVAVAFALYAWFRSEPRITVDVDPGLFWFYPFGKTLLGATHGHEAKLTDMPMIMANRVPEAWGASRWRYTHGFHIHHKSRYQFEAGGCIAESHQSPVQQDAWHSGRGYISQRSMTSITYHREHGEVARSTVAMV